MVERAGAVWLVFAVAIECGERAGAVWLVFAVAIECGERAGAVWLVSFVVVSQNASERAGLSEWC